MCLWQPSLGSVENTQLCSMPKFPVSLKPSARTVEARDSVREIFNTRPALTLERGIGRFADDTEIWQKGPFRAGITPDLPAVSSWKELGARLLGRQPAAPQVLNDHQETNWSGLPNIDQQYHVQTLAAQTCTHKQMRQRMLDACNCSNLSSKPPADALLLLSGSHPLRQLPWADRWMTNSLQTLKLAHELRLAGDLPTDVSFWAVENPLIHSTDRLKQKIAAGAEVIVTQPPLLWDRFEAWMNKVQQQNLLGETKLIVGCPMISSAANMKFWLHLCQASNLPDAITAIKPFSDAAADGKLSLAGHCQEYNAALVHKVLQFPEVAGLHVMPLTKQARQQTLPLLKSLSL